MAQPWPVLSVHSCKNSYKKCLEPVSFKAENIKPKAQFLCLMEGMGVGRYTKALE
ncbi:MAG: hypothetical protein ACLTW9_01000 [Enterocloster sp.]